MFRDNKFAFCHYSLVGLSPLIISSCNSTDGDIRIILMNNNIDLDAFLNPIALILCYYTLVISSAFILNAKVNLLLFFHHSVNQSFAFNIFFHLNAIIYFNALN